MTSEDDKAMNDVANKTTPPGQDRPTVAGGGITTGDSNGPGSTVPSGPVDGGEFTSKAANAAVDSKLLIFVRGDDRDESIEEAVRISKAQGLVLIDVTRLDGEGRAPAIEAVLVGLRAMKGLAPIVVHGDLGPTDVGDPACGIVVNVAPATVRSRPETQYWVEGDGFVNRPTWQKKRG